MYALKYLKRQGRHNRYILCGICGNRRLLERIRAGQQRPEEWRVTYIGNAGLDSTPTLWRKAG